MKKFSSLFIAAFFALSLGLGLGTANAGTWTGATLINPLIGADSTQLKPVAAQADCVFTTAAGEGLTANDTITLTLTGGAKFSTVSPTLQPNIGDLGAGSATAAVPLSGGAEGDTEAVWRVTADVTAGATLTLNANAANIFDLTGVAVDGNVDLLLTLKTNTGLTIGTANQSFQADMTWYVFTGAAAETVALTAQTYTADVSATTGAYLKFTNDTLVGAPATTLTFKNESVAATLPASANISAQKILITLAGDFSGIENVVGAFITGCDSTGDITDGTAGEFLINTAKDHAYATNTGALATGANIVIAPTVTIDGTSAQAARTFTATVEVLEDGTTWDAHTAQVATTLYTVVRNGVSFVTTSVGQYNTIKIADRSGALPTAGGNIIINAYDADGNVIDEVSGITSLKLLSNETLIISGPDLQARFVSIPMKYEFAIESPQAVVTNVKIHPNGGFSSTVYTNVGDGAL